MTEPIPASRWVLLTEKLMVFIGSSPTPLFFAEFRAAAEQTLVFCQQCQLVHTTELAGHLLNTINAVLKQPDSMKSITPPTDGELNTMRTMATSIFRSLIAESVKRHQISLQTSDVSQKLRNVPLARMNETQKALRGEAMRCLETGAYRSACVMGWNFVYDVIRQWVFDNKRDEFNTVLTSKYKSNFPQPITDYAEFFESPDLTENVFLDCCKQANVVGGKTHETLRVFLRRRNQYAHPNDLKPTINQANAYVEDLLDILEQKPFRA